MGLQRFPVSGVPHGGVGRAEGIVRVHRYIIETLVAQWIQWGCITENVLRSRDCACYTSLHHRCIILRVLAAGAHHLLSLPFSHNNRNNLEQPAASCNTQVEIFVVFCPMQAIFCASCICIVPIIVSKPRQELLGWVFIVQSPVFQAPRPPPAFSPSNSIVILAQARQAPEPT